MKSRVCELCSGEASLYCESDAAYLCWSCDARVHQANFLVARHVRRTLCCLCKDFDGSLISGVGSGSGSRSRSVCPNCSAEGYSSSSSSSISSSLSCSSDCVSSTESLATEGKIRTRSRRIGRSVLDARAEGILVIWSRRMGLRSGCSLAMAVRVFGVCVRKFTVLPSRVCLASSLWRAANVCETRGVSTWQLERLEECSGVSKKMIVLVESRISRAVNVKKSSREDEEEEGWAECSDG